MAEKETKTDEQTADAATPAVDEGEPTLAVGAEAEPAEAVEPEAIAEPAADAVVADDVPAADEAMVQVPERTPPAAGAAEAAAPEEADTETADADVAAKPQPEVDASTPAVPAAEPVDDEPEAAADEASAAEEPPVAEEPEPAAAEEPVAEAEPAAAAAPAQPAGPKPKRKRLPRPLRRQRPRAKSGSAGGTTADRKPIVRLPKPEQERGRRNELQGTVVSAAMDKTIVVKVDTIKAHRRYGKVVRRSTKFHAHDEANQAKPGDVVRIVETRPLSKTKNWRLAEIVEAAR